jgi:hypothetical protein
MYFQYLKYKFGCKILNLDSNSLKIDYFGITMCCR